MVQFSKKNGKNLLTLVKKIGKPILVKIGKLILVKKLVHFSGKIGKFGKKIWYNLIKKNGQNLLTLVKKILYILVKKFRKFVYIKLIICTLIMAKN